MFHPVGFWHNPLSFVTLENHTNNQDEPGSTTYAGIRFNDDGSIDDIGWQATTYTQYGLGVQWNANQFATDGSLFDVRCSSISSGSWTVSGAAVGTYVGIDTDPIWYVSVSGGLSPTSKSVTAVFQIRDFDGVDVLDSATITCLAEN